MREGWVKIHRAIKDNSLWNSEPFTKAQAWVDILIEANHSDGGFFKRGIWVPVKRGQTGRSELTLANEWKWSRMKVRRYLNWLCKHSMIELKQDNKTTIITICNYEIYQGKEKSDDTASVTPNEHQTNTKRDTNKNVKNDKNYSEDSHEFRIARFLLGHIRKRKADFKEPNLQTWAKDADLLLRVDKRNVEEVKKVIAWSQNDEFWQDNILSVAKLRKQYDQLSIRMKKVVNIASSANEEYEETQKLLRGG